MHNAAFAAAGLPHVYLRYRVPAALLPDAVREAKALRMGGLNLTVPLKEIVLPLLDAVTHEAERIGAVNTLLFPPGGRTVGDNTDGRGFLAALRGRVRLSGARVRYAAAPLGCLFVDLVYGARPTPFLAGAARAGRPTLGGAHMLLHQGALAFEAWTGRRAPRAAMARALRAAGLALTLPPGAATVAARRPPTR